MISDWTIIFWASPSRQRAQFATRKGDHLEHKHKCDFVHLHCEERDRCIETLETIETFESLETLDTIESMKGFDALETLETMKTLNTMETSETMETIETRETLGTLDTIEETAFQNELVSVLKWAASVIRPITMSCKPQKLLDYFVPLTIFSYMDQVCGKIGRLTIGLTLYCFPPHPRIRH